MTIGNIYECMTQFELPKWNYGRDEFEDEIILVEKGSVWSLTICRFKDDLHELNITLRKKAGYYFIIELDRLS